MAFPGGFTNGILSVLIGGGIGSVLRYLVCRAAERHVGDSFAWGTTFVNLAGCLLIGFIAGLIDRAILPRAYRVLIITGFLGGFTTFSSFTLESVRMILDGSLGKGLANIGVNVVLGLTLTLAGLLMANKI
jgi:fluoride exporter